jgi:hypothetical protein
MPSIAGSLTSLPASRYFWAKICTSRDRIDIREHATGALDAMLGMALVVAFLMQNRNIRICRIRASRPIIALPLRVARRVMPGPAPNPDWRWPDEPAA